MIDWTSFTPLQAVIGGLLIGLAASLSWFYYGKIVGISGIMAGTFKKTPKDTLWRITFVAGLAASGWLYNETIYPISTIPLETDYSTLIIAGLLVGFGSRYAGGCTTGHAICGIARQSKRSLVGALVFMSAAFITVFITHHGIG